MMKWLGKWLSGAVVLAIAIVGAWWFVQQTASWQALDAMIRGHPAVGEEVGKVESVKLPLFGWSLDWANAKVNPEFDVRVAGTQGEARVHAVFRDGAATDAWMVAADGTQVPLLVK